MKEDADLGNKAKSTAFSIGLHALLFAAVFVVSTNSKGDAVVSPSDPLLAMLADPDADPTKAAGLVGKAPGLADGSLDGKELDDTLGEIFDDQSGDFGELPPMPPPPEPVPAEPVAAEPTPAKPAEAKPAEKPAAPKSSKPATQPKPTPAKKAEKPAEKKNTGGSRMSFAEWQKRNAGKNAQSSKPKNPGRSRGGTVKAPRIDVGKVVTGGGGRFGVPGGTGENGGEGGRAVASAQQLYAAEVARKLATHLDNVLAQSPLTLDETVVVTVRLSADAQGRITLVDVSGTSNALVRERVKSAVDRIGKFRRPPEGKAFTLAIPDVELRPQ